MDPNEINYSLPLFNADFAWSFGHNEGDEILHWAVKSVCTKEMNNWLAAPTLVTSQCKLWFEQIILSVISDRLYFRNHRNWIRVFHRKIKTETLFLYLNYLNCCDLLNQFFIFMSDLTHAAIRKFIKYLVFFYLLWKNKTDRKTNRHYMISVAFTLHRCFVFWFFRFCAQMSIVRFWFLFWFFNFYLFRFPLVQLIQLISDQWPHMILWFRMWNRFISYIVVWKVIFRLIMKCVLFSRPKSALLFNVMNKNLLIVYVLFCFYLDCTINSL